MWGHAEKATIYLQERKGDLTRLNHVETLVLYLQPPELWENKILLLSYPVCGILLWQPDVRQGDIV